MIIWPFIALFLGAICLEWMIFPSKHQAADTLCNLGVYVVYLGLVALWTPCLFDIYDAAFDFAVFDFGPYWISPKTPQFYLLWIGAFLLEDLAFYWFHRASHRLSILWAAHVTHHSSRRFNLSVGLRQSWFVFIAFPFWIPLVLVGFDPAMVLILQGLSLMYQVWLHTEVVPSLGPIELLFNTPRHHRVHHGANDAYVNKNFGGVLVIWDRLFGTLAHSTEPIRYGIDRNVGSNPVVVGVHGWFDLIRSWSLKGKKN